MWKATGKTTTLLLFLDSLSPKTEKLSLEETMDLSRDRLILEEVFIVDITLNASYYLFKHLLSTSKIPHTLFLDCSQIPT
jgi:hypothetical protein